MNLDDCLAELKELAMVKQLELAKVLHLVDCLVRLMAVKLVAN